MIEEINRFSIIREQKLLLFEVVGLRVVSELENEELWS